MPLETIDTNFDTFDPYRTAPRAPTPEPAPEIETIPEGFEVLSEDEPGAIPTLDTNFDTPDQSQQFLKRLPPDPSFEISPSDTLDPFAEKPEPIMTVGQYEKTPYGREDMDFAERLDHQASINRLPKIQEEPIDLDTIPVEVKAIRESTGEEFTITDSGRKAFDRTSNQISVYEQMLDCLGN